MVQANVPAVTRAVDQSDIQTDARAVDQAEIRSEVGYISSILGSGRITSIHRGQIRSIEQITDHEIATIRSSMLTGFQILIQEVYGDAEWANMIDSVSRLTENLRPGMTRVLAFALCSIITSAIRPTKKCPLCDGMMSMLV